MLEIARGGEAGQLKASGMPSSLSEILERRVAVSPAGEAYRQFEGSPGAWVSYSWSEVGRRVEARRQALQAEGLPPGARIGILAANGVEHVCLDQAALSLGFVPVPMHVIDNPESLVHVLADSGASCLFVDSAERWQKLQPFEARFPDLRRVVCLGGEPASPRGLARSLAAWLAAAPALDRGAEEPPRVRTDALAAIVYTSGTTGHPKGVMLSHRNVVSNIYSIMAVVPVLEGDVFLSFLPLSHTLERTAGYYLPMAAGASVVFARSVPQLMDDLAVVRPTVLVSVPRIYERAYARLRDAMQHRPVSRALFALAVRSGWARFQHARGEAAPGSAAWRCLAPALDRWVGARVRAYFGGRLRAAVTGGAPVPQSVARSFLALGVPVLEGYGLTESAPVVACNTPTDNHPGSVGRPLPGVEVRIGDRDELLVRGANVMLGYWRRPEDTSRAVDPGGWLHTGDQARIEDGRIFIRGRIKDILVTSTGEKIAPVDLETAILEDAAFDQAMVIGEGRPYVAALCVVNPEHWARAAARLGLDARDPASLRSRAALDWALSRIAEAVRTLPAYARPRAVYLTLEPWTVDAGLITPTLKPKRPALESRLSGAIAELYRGHG